MLTINGMTFRGQLTPDNAFEAICASFGHEPRKCRRFQLRHGIPVIGLKSNGVSNKVMLILVIVLVIINVILMLVFRHVLNKELKAEMDEQVS